MSFETAQAQHDRQEPPAGNEAICGCGERHEDHRTVQLVVDGETVSRTTELCPNALDDLLEKMEDTFTENAESQDDYRLRQAGL